MNETIEARAEGDWVSAWRRAHLNGWAHHDPAKMPKPESFIKDGKAQEQSQAAIVDAVRGLVAK